MLKPHVVLFGESVPRERVGLTLRWLEQSDAMLIVGSSLTVFSGFRYARRAAELGIPIALINRGRTRADDLINLKLEGCCADALAATAGMV
jgi:NAD-dependent SIR2 family protein deacetylase